MTTFKHLTPDEFIKQRVEHQIEWYARRANAAKKKYYLLQVGQIVLSAFLPLLAGFSDDQNMAYSPKYLIAGMGVVIAINGGLLTLFRYQELWTEYRATSEALKHENLLFQAGAPPYDGADAYKNFVINVESLISSQNAAWLKRYDRDRRPNDDQPQDP